MFLLSRWSGGLVASYGAKRPLIVGPSHCRRRISSLRAAVRRRRYWTHVFPRICGPRSGMAVSVAPLTTVVMGAVDQNRAGTASGINNAVARVAGLFAVAILGMLMVDAFSHYMNVRLNQMNILPMRCATCTRMSPGSPLSLFPKILDPGTTVQLKTLIHRSFVFGFRTVMLLCAGLSLMSSGFAWRSITPMPISTAPSRAVQATRSAARGFPPLPPSSPSCAACIGNPGLRQPSSPSPATDLVMPRSANAEPFARR